MSRRTLLAVLAAAVVLPARANVSADLAEDPLWFLGVLLEIGSSLAGTLGKQLWRLAALAAPGALGPALRRNPKVVGLYVIGIVLTLCEPPVDSVALTYAPMSIIAACAGLSVAWNVVLAPCLLGEQLTMMRVGVAATIVFGTVLIGVFGPHTEVRHTASEYMELLVRPASLVYYGCIVLLGCLVGSRIVRSEGERALPAVLAALGVGNQFLLKIATELIACAVYGASREGCTDRTGTYVNPFDSWEVYVVSALAFGISTAGLAVLALTLRDAEALDTLPIYQGTVIVVGAVSGAIVLQEQQNNEAWRIMCYCFSLLLVVVSLALLALRESPSAPPSLRLPDRPISWPWYEATAATMRKRVFACVSMRSDALPLVAVPAKGAGQPSEASGLLTGGTKGK
jgi:multidrug transporter EmrE-like cation transporter